MNTDVPASYRSGIDYVEKLNVAALTEWLRAELEDKVHILAGQPDDYPVQALLNHFRYLSVAAQQRLVDATDVLILDWRNEPSEWSESAARALLNLAAELPVNDAKLKLETLVLDASQMTCIPKILHPAIFRTLAAHATNDDRAFWLRVSLTHQPFAGFAFQVLARIAPDDAFTLLTQLPDNEEAVGSVCRTIGRFIAQFAADKQTDVLGKIASCTSHLTRSNQELIDGAIKAAGFEPTSRSSEDTWNAPTLMVVLRKLGLHASPSTVVLGYRGCSVQLI